MSRATSVVVVDDCPVERLLWRRLLTRRFGEAVEIDVLEDPDAAIARIGLDVDLLIVDWEMPGVGGAGVAAAAVERGIGLARVAFLSGHPRQYLAARLGDGVCAGIFDKNCRSSREELLALVDRMVERRASAGAAS